MGHLFPVGTPRGLGAEEGSEGLGLQVGLVTLLLQARPRAERRFAPVNERQLSTEGFP